MRPLDNYIKNRLERYLETIGNELGSDAIAIVSPIVPGVDLYLRQALEAVKNKHDSVTVILETPGGVVEVIQRMVTTVRHMYESVIVIVPDHAMSAGTIFALSANRIMMDYFSCLGPIDPQIERDGKLVPALSYLNQYERLNEKSAAGNLTTAEYTLLSKLDLGELYQFEQARELSIELLIRWLSQYKFKDWKRTETSGKAVTQSMKRTRAKKIADLLNDTNRWHSHGRAIDMQTLRDEVGLKVEDMGDAPELSGRVREYFNLLKDYMAREEIYSFIHTKDYF